MANCAFCGQIVDQKKAFAYIYMGAANKITFCWQCNIDGKIEEYLDRLEDEKYNSSVAERSNYS